MQTSKGSVYSYLWSIPKNVWLTGPNVSQTNYEFINACAIALNATTVLFIGLSNSTSYGNRSYIPNDLTATYNFEVGGKSKHICNLQLDDARVPGCRGEGVVAQTTPIFQGLLHCYINWA